MTRRPLVRQYASTLAVLGFCGALIGPAAQKVAPPGPVTLSAHQRLGRDEKMRVKSFYEGLDFLDQVVCRITASPRHIDGRPIPQ